MLGGSCLGIRHTDGSSPPACANAWHITHTPSWWRDVDVIATLHGAGWTESEVIHPPRGKKGWLVKAMAPTTIKGDVIGITCGIHTITLSRATPRAPRILEATARKTGKWWEATHPKNHATTQQATAPEPSAPTEEKDTTMGDVRNGQAESNQPTKKVKLAEAPRLQFAGVWRRWGMRVQCFVSCLLHGQQSWSQTPNQNT